MSSISAAGTGLAQFFQSLSNQSQPATIASDAVGSSGDSSQEVQSAHHHHHHGGGNSAAFQKIQAAVTQALQQTQSDPSADPNKAIEDAIEKVFQSGQAGASDPTTATSTDAAASTSTTDPTNPHEAFAQLLQSYGVTQQQFHDDFLNAVKDAQNGNVDPSTALQSFPAGAGFDEIG